MSKSPGSAFPPASIDEWMALADKVLGDDDFEEILVRHTAGHLRIDPLYDRAGSNASTAGTPGVFPFRRGTTAALEAGRWDIRQRHDLIDPAATNRNILADLAGGVTSILLRTWGETSERQLEAAFVGVHLDMIDVAFDAGPWVDSLDAAWTAMCATRETSGRRLRRTDPIGAATRFGEVGSASLNAVSGAVGASPELNGLVAVDATVWTDRGADEVQEVAWSLATAVSYLRLLVDSEGWPLDRAAAAIEFSYAALPEQFTTMAKFRAARRCWARIVQAAGGSAAASAQRQHALTPECLFTKSDPHMNLLRSSTAALAAVAGGAPSVTVAPFDSALGQPSELGRRTARNIQLLLQEEAHLGWVSDPGGGSWFMEDHTDDLAGRAWEKFQQIEAHGGMLVAVERGVVEAELAVRVAERRAAERTRQSLVVGANAWVPPVRSDPAAEPEPWPSASVGPIPTWRSGEVFDELRDRTAARQPAPAVLLAFGTPARVGARTGWVDAALADAGLACSLTDSLSDPADAAATWRNTQPASAAIICAPNSDLPKLVPGVARALSAAGCPRVLVAGDPGGHRDLWEQSGVHDFIFNGADLVQVVDAMTSQPDSPPGKPAHHTEIPA